MDVRPGDYRLIHMVAPTKPSTRAEVSCLLVLACFTNTLSVTFDCWKDVRTTFNFWFCCCIVEWVINYFSNIFVVLLCIFLGMEDEICPYATFHLLGFREENMDPSKAGVNFQTFPQQNGSHTGTLGHSHNTGTMHQRSGSQSMVSTESKARFSYLFI